MTGYYLLSNTLFKYRDTNGVLEAKNMDNIFTDWVVINQIPKGARLCSSTKELVR